MGMTIRNVPMAAALLCLVLGCSTPKGYFLVQYDLEHTESIASQQGTATLHGPIRITHCDSALCGRLGDLIEKRAQTVGISIEPDAPVTLHIGGATLGSRAEDLYTIKEITYAFQTEPSEKRKVTIGTDKTAVDARCRTELFAFVDATPDIDAVLQAEVSLRTAQGETVWQLRHVWGDERLLEGEPRFIYRTHESLGWFGWEDYGPETAHETVCKTQRLPYPLLGSEEKGFGSVKPRDVLLFRRSQPQREFDVETTLATAAHAIVDQLEPGPPTPPVQQHVPVEEDSAPAATPREGSDPAPDTSDPSSDQ